MRVYIEEIDREGRVKERIVYRNRAFHYGLYTTPEHAPDFNEFPWHWHKDFEFGLVLSGKILYKTNYQEFLLEAGDGVFINAGVLHTLVPADNPSEIRLQSQFFDRAFLAGEAGSALDIRYVLPVLEQKRLDAVPVYGARPENRNFLGLLRQALVVGAEEDAFYELRLRSLFSSLWEQVYCWATDEQMTLGDYNAQEDHRIKQILAYIQEHYGEKLTVRDMAATGHISQRECYRLFQRRLDMTPIEYLVSFRLQCARQLLLESEKSVLEIALETGFGTSSYLGKVLKQHCGLSPREYRVRYCGAPDKRAVP